MNTLETLKTQPIYHSSKEDTWTGVNWSKVEKTIENLQHRITKAAEKGNFRKVRNLQRLLTKRSLSASLKSIRIVSQENFGKKTPGIDGQLWTTPESKHKAALELRQKSDTKPLKQVYISKTKGIQGSFAIPCMSDRASQVIWNLALLPMVEATSDHHSYGFRPCRDCWDVNAQIRTLLDKPESAQWVLIADIEKCFNKINQNWLLNHTPMETKVLKSWLKAGYFERLELFPTEESMPQKEVILPTLSNLTLNGLENYLKKNFKGKRVFCSRGKNLTKFSTCINVVRYANDFIVTGRSHRQLQRVKKAITKFLAPKGLRINENKTSIRNVLKGFDFLGWTFRKYPNGTFLCTISNQSKIKHRKEIKYLIKNTHNPAILIPKLNSKIRGWMNYHHCANNIWKVWAFMNKYLYERLIKWCLKRHSNKTKKWVFRHYWKRINERWTFVTSTQNESYTLIHYDLGQKRMQSKICSSLNVFDLKNKAKIRQLQLAKNQKFSYQKRNL
uniref:Putative reverse transcriptase and intron maturase n=1 Tax=Gloeotilopsis planctonica TaxID=34157 RepID=A0A1B2RZ92_9CHLO|nr:putative reverse transcriptase and intron maturase [Gloeotilopsis planctonica]